MTPAKSKVARKGLVRKMFRGARVVHRLGLDRMYPLTVLTARLKAALVVESPVLPGASFMIELGSRRLYIPYQLVGDYVLKDFEPKTQEIFVRVIRPGMTVLDVGANIGYYTLLAAGAVGDQGHVCAVEPGPDNLQYLRYNVDTNRLNNVEVIPHPATDVDGNRTLVLHKHGTLHTLLPATRGKPPSHSVDQIAVRAVALDSIIETIVDVAKVDVEGAEIEVLKGMRQIISRSPDIRLFIEWNPRTLINAGYKAQDLPDFCSSLGFEVVVIDDSSRQLRPVGEVLELLATGSLDAMAYFNLLAARDIDSTISALTTQASVHQ